MKNIHAFILSLPITKLLAILFLVSLVGFNLLFAQDTSPAAVTSFNVWLLVPLFIGILAHWLKSYSRDQAPNLIVYLLDGLKNTLMTFIGAIGTLIGLVAASPAQYEPVTFVVLFNVFLIGFSWDSAAGGSGWKAK